MYSRLTNRSSQQLPLLGRKPKAAITVWVVVILLTCFSIVAAQRKPAGAKPVETTKAQAQAPNAELHAAVVIYYGDGGCCCWEIEVWQEEGIAGNITYVDAQVATPGVTVTSVSGPVPGPGSQPPVLLSPTSIRWHLPQPDGLWMVPQTLQVCFNGVPASGVTITLVGHENGGGTSDLLTTNVNVGESGECGFLSDLWVKDTMAPDLPEDFGVEPNSVSQQLWISQDIWVRTSPDATITSATNPGSGTSPFYANEHQHQNPTYLNATTPSHVYVKVRNRGTDHNYYPQMLRVYWADANTGLPWPVPGVTGPNVWNEIDCVPGGAVDPCTLPSISPGQDYVVQLPWVPPDPTQVGTNGHFCLIARIESVPWYPYGMATTEGSTLWINVANNNNIAWKNVTVVSGTGSKGSGVGVRNTFDHEAVLTLRFGVPARELKNNFLMHGDIFVELGDALMQKWRRSGQQARGFVVVDKTTIRITDPAHAELGGLRFSAHEEQTIKVRMQLRRDARVAAGTTFNWDIFQLAPSKNNARPSVIGGERYTLTVPKRSAEITAETK